MAPTESVLIGFRLVQGVAAAMAMPSTLALLTASFSGEERGAAIGSWASWGAVAAALGPPIAGVLIVAVSWRAIFFLSLPLVATAMAIGVWAVEESRDERVTVRHVDLAGAALAALGLGSLSFALVQGPTLGWSHAPVLLAAVIGAISLGAFVWREWRAKSPMLPLPLFRVRNFTAANGATLALYAVFNGNFFILTIYLQTVLRYSALAAGLATLPVTLLMIALASRLGRLAARTGPRLPMSVGILLTGVGLGLLTFLQPGDAYALHVLPGVMVFGLGLALTVPPLTNAAVSAVPDPQAGLASGVNDEVARVAALLGVAVCGLAFATIFRISLEQANPTKDPERTRAIQLALGQPSGALEIAMPQALRHRVLPELREASIDAYRSAMAAGVVIALAGSLVSFMGIETPTTAETPGER